MIRAAGVVRYMSLVVFGSLTATGALARPACDDVATEAAIAPIRDLRLSGRLQEARLQIETMLDRGDVAHEPRHQIALRLELARVLDRVGLHRRTRPVAAALLEIERAEHLSGGLGASVHGAIALARANYFYRAEMPRREFPQATAHCLEAIDLLKEAGDTRARSDAVHQLGLIHLQRREFARARELFDESLTLDQKAGSRKWMLGEYHRHVAFVLAQTGESEAALTHFERSLYFRKESGAIDASLFAAISLGNALVGVGASDAAQPHFEYGLRVAREIDSPVGMASAAFALGSLHERAGRHALARVALQTAARAAASVSDSALAERVKAVLERLDSVG